MTRAQRKLWRRVCRVVNDRTIPIRIRRLPTDRGRYEDGEVCVDWRDDMLPTLIHECLHASGDETEEQIAAMETELKACVSTPQAVRLLKRFAARVRPKKG